jgi:hypothetical protein
LRFGTSRQKVRHVDRRTSLGHFYQAAPVRGSSAAKMLAFPHRLYSSSIPGPSAGARRDGLADVLEKLLAALVEGGLRPLPVMATVVDFEDILCAHYERGVFFGRNAEARHAPRLRLIFFRPRWTVLGLTEVNTWRSTSLSARGEMVHRARPFGGALQAI